MPVTINGNGSITGLSVGGLGSGVVNTATLANGGAAGKHPDTPFLTITKALGTATAGDTIIVAPGEYQETFPMTVPDGVTLRGTNLRSTSVKPTGVTNANTAFKLSGDSVSYTHLRAHETDSYLVCSIVLEKK